MLLRMMLSELFGERCSKQASSGRTEDSSADMPCSGVFDTRTVRTVMQCVHSTWRQMWRQTEKERLFLVH